MTTFKKVANNATSTLTAAIAAADASLSVAAGDGAKFPASDFWVTVEDFATVGSMEIVHVSTRTGDALTLDVRGDQTSGAKSHTAGSAVRLLWTAQAAADIHTAINALEGRTAGHTITDGTTNFTPRSKLKVTGGAALSDDAPNDQTVIDLTPLAGGAATAPSAGREFMLMGV